MDARIKLMQEIDAAIKVEAAKGGWPFGDLETMAKIDQQINSTEAWFGKMYATPKAPTAEVCENEAAQIAEKARGIPTAEIDGQIEQMVAKCPAANRAYLTACYKGLIEARPGDTKAVKAIIGAHCPKADAWWTKWFLGKLKEHGLIAWAGSMKDPVVWA